jgi:DNA invertase Pin-like site-specific DNA recombinase
MTTAAAVYCRISQDREGLAFKVQDQEAACRAEIERRGWRVAEVFTDNDLSASRFARKKRPAYLAMVVAIKARRVRAVVALSDDRLGRTMRDREDLIDVATEFKVPVVTLKSGEFDLTTADGRAQARTLAVWAARESEKMSERIQDGVLRAARAGKPAGGNRPFGFEPDKVTVRESEAALVREGARKVLAGASLKSLGREWGMHPMNVRRILVSGRIAGLRDHQGATYPAVWPAIVTPDEHEALVALLGSRTGPAPARSYLLTGFAVCGTCLGKMAAKPKPTARRYGCYTVGCPHAVSRLAEPVEAEVLARVFYRLDTEGLSRALKDQGDDGQAKGLAEVVRGYEARLAALEADYEEGGVDLPTWKRMRTSLLGKIEDARRALARETGRRLAVDLPSGAKQLRKWWEGADLDQRQALLRLLVERVVIKPVQSGRRHFDPSEVEVVWRV